MPKRCGWAEREPNLTYHDTEWGVPVRDDRRLFELLILEGAQAGLSWETILKKRANYRAAFDGFDPRAVARYDARKIRALLADAGIVRNRLKVASAIGNARAWLELDDPVAHLWSFVGGAPRANRFRSLADLPAETAESAAMSKDLKPWGFRFVGPTICYAFMQAAGMVNDHVTGCLRWQEVQ